MNNLTVLSTTKVVYNACYGGFSLSEEAILRYAEIKGITLYPEHRTTFGSIVMSTYWLKPEGERPNQDGWHLMSLEERQHSNKIMSEAVLEHRDISRSDPILAQVVEELGDRANGTVANLKITEVPKGIKYRIDEYDGYESVMTVDDYVWFIA